MAAPMHKTAQPAALGPQATGTAERRSLRLLLLAGLAAAALALPAAASPQGTMAAPTLAVGGDEHAIARRIDLSIGRSIVVDLPRDAKEVFVADPKIANAVVRSTRKVFLIGVADGATSIFVMDAAGRQIAAFEITVGRDLNILRQTLRTAMPHAQIEVKPAGESVLLVGSVANAGEAQQASDIAGAFLGDTGGANGSGGQGAGGSPSRVINALTIRGKDQVMLRVTVAEIKRNVVKQLGIDTTGEWRLGDMTLTGAVTNAFGLGNESPASSIGVSGGGNSATLRALEQAGVARTLAEPTLTAVSGETATFLVGGEVPIPTGYDCQGPNGSNCTTTVTFKKFGVALTFTPVVQSEARMSLRVATEVSEIDNQNTYRSNTLIIPGFTVRRSETTVELPSGGTLVTAGLIQQKSRQAINGFPGLLNIPILGTLFRSRDYQRDESELMIAVTPYIAKPMSANAVTRPDAGFADAMDPQTVFLGRLNRVYGKGSNAPQPAVARGIFGFIND
ncbi:type II and III secretion system protein family protein [Chelatococcus daeguensis]|nr:secretin [Chelatococcus daeguensis]MBM3084331.1 type II and III secretion system protein family protein [Chelatococcus daeguensis]